MSERLLETFRDKAEQVARVPAFELIEAAGRAPAPTSARDRAPQRLRCVLATTGHRCS